MNVAGGAPSAWGDSGASPANGDELSARYRSDDEDRRAAFGRALAAYVRGHRDRWNITTFLDVLHRLGEDVDDVELNLRRTETGDLRVRIAYTLPPIHPPGRGGSAGAPCRRGG